MPRDTEAETAAAVSIRGITKRFGAVTALDAATFDIRKGEFFSLLGPSGCGKTTLLRIIGGFEAPTEGELLIGGRPALQDPPYRRRTNMIFQHGALFPHLTIAGNIAFGLEMKRKPAAEIARRVAEALEMVRLADYGDRLPDQLSGGQRQRIALARALVNDPEVLLLDEPLSALDLQLRLHMQEELRRLHRMTGRTFVFVTHDQGEAIAMSDRIAVMRGGQVLQIGSPKEIYERPAHRFVAEFMGHSNFYDGKVLRRDTDGAGLVQVGGQAITCRLPDGYGSGRDVILALRYERVEVVPATAEATGLEGTILSEDYFGPTLRRVVDLGAMGRILADMANNGREASLGTGARVRVRWAPDSLAVLEP